jgi:hypothetical protein
MQDGCGPTAIIDDAIVELIDRLRSTVAEVSVLSLMDALRETGHDERHRMTECDLCAAYSTVLNFWPEDAEKEEETP